MSRSCSNLSVLNKKTARNIWGSILTKAHFATLAELTKHYQFSVAMGDLLLLDGQWYVTSTGLTRLARRSKCIGIHTRPVPEFSDASNHVWTFEATVFKSRTCKGFVAYGDSSNVSPLLRGAEMRVAETRAVNRALRKAYGIGCSVEEIGSNASQEERIPPQNTSGNGNGGGPKVRDRLCQLIRQHSLDAGLVKAFAADYCSVKSLRDASREQVENFVRELAEWAEKDRNGLQCQLNSYAGSKPEEAA